MDRVICNPMNLSYRYQHVKGRGKVHVYREGADPTLVLFKNTYYLFVSMAAGFWYSEDLIHWEHHENKNLLIHDYAPDARQIGDYLYFCASGVKNCPILRTRDPFSDQFEQVSDTMAFWDPDIFSDDDGRVYLYWGCSPTDPIFGVELDTSRMTPISKKASLVKANPRIHGFERGGENCNPNPGKPMKRLSYTEGSYMTRHDGRYYLQYAIPGTEYNTYSDAVGVSDKPLGPFTFSSHNPFSSKPGGFITGAGHGSTVQDKYGNWWHAATMRISVNHIFERRVGLFPAGFDEDGTLFCNQNFSDYPILVPEGKFDPWSIEPEWMLLSYKKEVTASSYKEGHEPALAVNEDIRTWWSTASNKMGEYIQVDLGEGCTVHAIQVNIADENVRAPRHEPQEYGGNIITKRYIETGKMYTRYILEGSLDGKEWLTLVDKRETESDLSHDFFVFAGGRRLRYIRVTAQELPYYQELKVSGLRVFGKGMGEKPAQATVTAKRTGNLNAFIRWNKVTGSQGYNIRYGVHPDKLYSSWLVYGETQLNLPTLNKGMTYYVCVDSFNENGITKGRTIEIISR